MKLYKVYCKESAGWDTNQGFVVRAESESAARALCQKNIFDEKWEAKDFWENPKFSTCEEISLEGAEEVILNDFLAG